MMLMNLICSRSRVLFFVLIAVYVSNGYAAPSVDKSAILKDISNVIRRFRSFEFLYDRTNSTLLKSLVTYFVPGGKKYEHGLHVHTRSKRQSGGGKFVDAAKMGQTKLMQLITQMFKNTWDDVYVGGAHPLHHEVPKPVVYLFKQKIYSFMFPEVGQPDKTQ